MLKTENRTKTGTEGLNVPRTELIGLAFDEDESFINPEDDEDTERQKWLSSEQCNQRK